MIGPRQNFGMPGPQSARLQPAQSPEANHDRHLSPRSLAQLHLGLPPNFSSAPFASFRTRCLRAMCNKLLHTLFTVVLRGWSRSIWKVGCSITILEGDSHGSKQSLKVADPMKCMGSLSETRLSTSSSNHLLSKRLKKGGLKSWAA